MMCVSFVKSFDLELSAYKNQILKCISGQLVIRISTFGNELSLVFFSSFDLISVKDK